MKSDVDSFKFFSVLLPSDSPHPGQSKAKIGSYNN